jgi:hypothetical protein
MIDVKQYRETGYLYDSLENYTDLFSFEDFKEVKNFIDSTNIRRYARYDYWLKYKELSYIEQLYYNTYLIKDTDLNAADEMFAIAHRYQIKKIQENGINPTWVFGTSENMDINSMINNGVITNFENNFVKKYYPENENSLFEDVSKLQFYDKGCEIKLHDDGQPGNRICVFLFFLNNEWNDENGGNLLLYTKDNQIIKIKPTFPNFVVLDSDINLLHEVEKVKNDTKYNIVSFLSNK